MTQIEKKTVKPGYATDNGSNEIELINRVSKFDVVKVKALADLLETMCTS